MLNFNYNLWFISSILVILINNCYAINSELSSLNTSLVFNFSPAVATWYGPPDGYGSGGACGYKYDVAYPPYNGVISAGNNFLFKSGQGCGSCYQVKCTQHPSCSGVPIIVTITDECPGCNDAAIHFDLSGKAFGLLAKPSQEYALQNAGKIGIEYRRIDCNNHGVITFIIDAGSNPYYLAFVIENENGDGDVGEVKILPANSNGFWLSMQQSWGATWKVDLPSGMMGPFSVKVTSIESKRTSTAYKAIPAGFVPGKRYYSHIV